MCVHTHTHNSPYTQDEREQKESNRTGWEGMRNGERDETAREQERKSQQGRRGVNAERAKDQSRGVKHLTTKNVLRVLWCTC